MMIHFSNFRSKVSRLPYWHLFALTSLYLVIVTLRFTVPLRTYFLSFEHAVDEQVTQSTAGEKWFDMPATELTPTVKRDLTLLQMRDVLDPKRHYRSSAKNLPKFFQVSSLK